MLKCLRRILEMRGSAGLYVTTNGTTSLEALGLVCNALVREILARGGGNLRIFGVGRCRPGLQIGTPF